MMFARIIMNNLGEWITKALFFRLLKVIPVANLFGM